MEKNKKLGLGSVVSVSVGLVIATSCLVVSGCHSFVVNIVGIINLVSRYALQENGEFPSLIREIIA